MIERNRRAFLAILVGVVWAAVPAWAGGEEKPAVDVRIDVEYGVANGKRLLLDAYVPAPEGDKVRPAVILIHGGGFRAGDKRSFEPEARRLAEKGWVAFSVNYRLDEPTAFPAEVEDVQAAVRWVRANAAEYQVDPERIGALGESAGGHLTAMLATLGEGALDRGARIRAGVAWSGPMDLTELARLRGDQWGVPLLGCSLAACPERFAAASPIAHVDGTDAPLFLINSTEELVPRSQAVAMATRVEDLGAPTQLQIIPGTRHALDYRDEVWPQTDLFLQKHLASGDEGTSPGTIAFVATVAVVLLGAVLGTAVVLGRRRSAATPAEVPTPV
ncbi:MAG: alpha/beta hydrolase [Actinomycetota bacterium]|nr:alpha/beta hydrolase [Actinomycetota bacterium]